MSRPKRGRLRGAARLVLPSVAAAAVTAVGFAAFTDDASNAGNQASAASVTISEDVPASSPLFDLQSWQPGEDDTVSRCIGIVNDGSIPLRLKMRLDGAPTGQLGDYIDVKVQVGSRDRTMNTSDCTTFKADPTVAETYVGELDEFPSSAGSGLSDKADPLGVGAERAFKVTWHLQDTEAAEGKSVGGVNFLWETSSAD